MRTSIPGRATTNISEVATGLLPSMGALTVRPVWCQLPATSKSGLASVPTTEAAEDVLGNSSCYLLQEASVRAAADTARITGIFLMQTTFGI